MTEPLPKPLPDPARTAPERAGEAADLDSRQLFGERTEIRIAHADAIYRLRITRAGKLILNK